MNKKNSHWILGLVYINPDDTRLFVPLPIKLGLAINFWHHRSVRVLFWIWVGLVFGLIVTPIIAHPSYFASNPTPIIWVILANLAALGIIRLNRSFPWSAYRLIDLASFGLAAAGIGFFFQRIINHPLVTLWGAENLYGRTISCSPRSQPWRRLLGKLRLFSCFSKPGQSHTHAVSPDTGSLSDSDSPRSRSRISTSPSRGHRFP